MTFDQIKPYLTAIVRHGLTVAAGALATSGVLSSTQGAEFTDVGSALVLGAIGLGWSWWQKHHQAKGGT